MKFNFEVKEIHKVYAIDFVQKFHYSPVMPKLTKHFLGFYLDGELKGVLTLGWGTQPRQTINKMFPGLTSKDYYEIGKMCMDDDMPRNSESQMISATVRWMKKNTDCLFLYTMADGIMGKCGYVYQASNFYFGEKYWTPVYLMENGEKLHPRSSNSLCKENAKFLEKKYGKKFLEKYKPDANGERYPKYFTSDFMLHRGIKRIDGLMFRYLYPLNKKAKKIMLKDSSMPWSKKYPKDKDFPNFRAQISKKHLHFLDKYQKKH